MSLELATIVEALLGLALARPMIAGGAIAAVGIGLWASDSGTVPARMFQGRLWADGGFALGRVVGSTLPASVSGLLGMIP